MNNVQRNSAFNGVAALIDICHDASVSSGWWTDLETGADMRDPEYMRKYRLVQEKIALIHSEVSEALEGYRKDKPDEHLPNFKNFDIELADAVIRICDLAGAMNIPLSSAIIAKLAYNAQRADHKLDNRKADGGKKF